MPDLDLSTKIIWLTDLHFGGDPDYFRCDPVARLEAAIAMIQAEHTDAVACVISGDLTNDGDPQVFSSLAGQLSALPMPLLPIPGNHDNRDWLRAALPLPDGAMEGFVQYRVPCGDVDVICLDTLIPGESGGELCPQRMAWLEKALAQDPDRPALVFMHHPPFSLGIGVMDQIRCANGDALLDLLAGSSKVLHLCCGHVHRPTSGTARSVPFTTLRAVSFQAPPPWPTWGWDSFAPPDETPQIGVVLTDGRDVVIHALDLAGTSP
jgi:3',5'-cyclic AMP phosphodiesterase CpdA